MPSYVEEECMTEFTPISFICTQPAAEHPSFLSASVESRFLSFTILHY